MRDNVYITLAIHTYDMAVALKQELESAGVPVQLENVDICNPRPACGVRVRIPEGMLPKALNIVENRVHRAQVEMKINGMQKKVLVPVDFSEYSMTACKVAFAFARKMSLHPVLMHVYATPYFDGSLSFPDSFTVDMRDSEVRKNLQDAASLEMKRFCAKIDSEIANGKMPAIGYSRNIAEGVPEDVILDYTRRTPPELVVMATRDANKKARELIGSVTAEVLDNCRVPVFTVPENFEFGTLGQLVNAVFFCNIDQHDLLAMDMFVELFPSEHSNITLLPVTDKRGSQVKDKLEVLMRYFQSNYTTFTFDYKILEQTDFRVSFERLVQDRGVDLLIVPNKKKNVFVRLFRPGIAHKILFEGNMPMLTLPI